MMNNNKIPQMNGINTQQFQKWLPQINENILEQLAQQARQQGISEKDIQNGLDFIKKMRSSS